MPRLVHSHFSPLGLSAEIRQCTPPSNPDAITSPKAASCLALVLIESSLPEQWTVIQRKLLIHVCSECSKIVLLKE